VDHYSISSTIPQPWSWKVCALLAVVAVTIDVLIVQSPLVWLGAAGVLTILAQFKSPMSGLAVVLFTCGLLNYSPFEIGALSRLYAGDVAIAIFLIAWFGRQTSWPCNRLFQPNLINRPLLGMAVITPLSMLWSRLHPDPSVTYNFPHSDVSWATVQASQLALFAAMICIPFAVAATIKSWKNVETVVMMIGAVVAIGTLMTAAALIFGFGGSYAILGATRAYWEQPWDSSMEPLTALVLPFLYSGVLFGRRSVPAYWLICVLFVLCLLGVVLTFSRESWLLAFAGLFLVSALWLRRRVTPALALIMIVVLVVTVVFSGAIGLIYHFYNPDEVYGLERIYYYATALQLFTTHPLLGVGAGNYQFFDRSYTGEAAGGIAHNQFLTVAAETGILGLMLLLWLMIALLRIRRKLLSSEGCVGDSHYWVKAAGSAFVLVWIAEGFFQEAFFVTAAAGGGTKVVTATVFPWVLLGVLFAACNLGQTTAGNNA
jgi:O-antigen ligase